MSYGIYPKGVIYDAKKAKPQGEFVLRASFPIRFAYTAIRGLASGLIGFFIISLMFYVYPIIKEEALFRLHQKEIKVQKTSAFGNLLKTAEAEQVNKTKKEAESLQLNPYFSVVIPKIGVKADVMANVDPSNETEYLNEPL